MSSSINQITKLLNSGYERIGTKPELAKKPQELIPLIMDPLSERGKYGTFSQQESDLLTPSTKP